MLVQMLLLFCFLLQFLYGFAFLKGLKHSLIHRFNACWLRKCLLRNSLSRTCSEELLVKLAMFLRFDEMRGVGFEVVLHVVVGLLEDDFLLLELLGIRILCRNYVLLDRKGRLLVLLLKAFIQQGLDVLLSQLVRC